MSKNNYYTSLANMLDNIVSNEMIENKEYTINEIVEKLIKTLDHIIEKDEWYKLDKRIYTEIEENYNIFKKSRDILYEPDYVMAGILQTMLKSMFNAKYNKKIRSDLQEALKDIQGMA